MASRFERLTDPDKAWEYRQVGLLYWLSPFSLWVPIKADTVSRDRQASMMYDDYQYAILVEEDDSPTTKDDSDGQSL